MYLGRAVETDGQQGVGFLMGPIFDGLRTMQLYVVYKVFLRDFP